jgi:hypothetical protein
VVLSSSPEQEEVSFEAYTPTHTAAHTHTHALQNADSDYHSREATPPSDVTPPAGAKRMVSPVRVSALQVCSLQVMSLAFTGVRGTGQATRETFEGPGEHC